MGKNFWKGSSHYDMCQRGTKPNEKYKSGVRKNPAGDEKDLVAAPLTTSKSYTYKKHFYKVPYAEKEQAKQIGMKWSTEEKHWYHSSKDRREGKAELVPRHWEYAYTKEYDTSF